MYFYYSAWERLANLDSAPTPGLSLAGLGAQPPVSEAEGARDVSDSETQSDKALGTCWRRTSKSDHRCVAARLLHKVSRRTAIPLPLLHILPAN
jgi:hypothetical protein